MSKRNGDRARFQKDRRRKLLRRQRIQALVVAIRNRSDASAVKPATEVESETPLAHRDNT
jgi:hypothetical protein